MEQSRRQHYCARTTQVESIRQHLPGKMRVWREREDKRRPREWAHVKNKCDYHLSPFRLDRLDMDKWTNWEKRQQDWTLKAMKGGPGKGGKKEAQAWSKAGAESLCGREQAQESFSSRQWTLSNSYMKVTAFAALQLLLLPAVSASSQPSPRPV